MFRVVFVLLAVSAAVLALGRGEDTTTVEQHPYHVSIELDGKHICSGAIIDEKIILTVASCVHSADPKNLRIRAGTSKLQTSGTTKDVMQVIPHERYTEARKDFDIAVIVLHKKLRLGVGMQAVTLPTTKKAPASGTEATLTGYKIKNTEKTDLEVADVTVSVPIDCKNAYASLIIYITDRMFCGKYITEKCKMDPGAPLVKDNVLLGLSAWEQQCGTRKYPGIYTNVAELTKWIKAEAKL